MSFFYIQDLECFLCVIITSCKTKTICVNPQNRTERQQHQKKVQVRVGVMVDLSDYWINIEFC